MSTVVPERVASVSSQAPMTFTLSRGNGQSIVVEEAQGRSGGLFTDMSSAMRFVETQCLSHKCKPDMRFDASLAFIRAAG